MPLVTTLAMDKTRRQMQGNKSHGNKSQGMTSVHNRRSMIDMMESQEDKMRKKAEEAKYQAEAHEQRMKEGMDLIAQMKGGKSHKKSKKVKKTKKSKKVKRKTRKVKKSKK